MSEVALMQKRILTIFAVLVISSAVLIINSVLTRSSVVGTVASLVFLYVNSTIIGELFFAHEGSFIKRILGLACFLVFIVFAGSALIVAGKFTATMSLGSVIAVSVFFFVYFLYLRRKNFEGDVGHAEKKKDVDSKSLLLSISFITLLAIAFGLLFQARTGEGGASVWLTIPSVFIPVFLLVTLSLVAILFFTSLNVGIKLGLICAYTFLAHSLFLLVWYPGRYGDPWFHLGEARYISRTGMPYAYDWMLSNFLLLDLFKYRAQYALVVFFEKMFSVDVYWVHIALLPVLWSIFVPVFSYKVAEMMTARRSKAFPLLAAVVIGLFESLIGWGAVSVPNSFGFIFFFLSMVFFLYWMTRGGKSFWFLSFLSGGVAFLAHPQGGFFALMLLFWGTVIQKSSRSLLKVVSYLLMFAVYPLALYLQKASFSLSGLFVLDNFMSFESKIATFLLVFGLVGLILGIRERYVSAKKALMLFFFYIAVIMEYYFTQYGMTNVPYSPGRILTMGDFLLAPFVALGLLTIAEMLSKAALRRKINVSVSFFSRKISVKEGPRLLGMLLICLFVTLQATSVLYQTYPRDEIMKVQPSAYELEAVKYIDSTTPGRYVVLCDTQLASLAIGFLGKDYGYLGGTRGVYGIPSFGYPTIQMFLEMEKQPSINIMLQGMAFADAVASYFVVSVRRPKFDKIVQETLEILPAEKVFGGGKLYVFKYPLPIIEEPGPQVRVIFDDGANTSLVQTRFVYMFETEVNSTLTLSGHSNYNVTEFPSYWTFLDLTVNNASRGFDESSDINTFVYVNGLKPQDVLTVTWRSKPRYSAVGWKEDSFKSEWHTHERYRGTIMPKIETDGNILSLSFSFTLESYQYYYYVKSTNISTSDYDYVIVRWRATGRIAVAAVYFDYGSQEIVPLGSESFDWTVTIVKLPSGLNITSVMVGVTNLRLPRDTSGELAMDIDYILVSAETPL